MLDYEALLTCFRSEQLSAAEFLAHMANDAGFSAYVEGRLQEASSLNAAPNQKSHLAYAGK